MVRYGSGARILSIGIASHGVLDVRVLLDRKPLLGKNLPRRIGLLWSVMFVVISVIYLAIEQLLSRTIADRRARGHDEHPLGIPITIQAELRARSSWSSHSRCTTRS